MYFIVGLGTYGWQKLGSFPFGYLVDCDMYGVVIIA